MRRKLVEECVGSRVISLSRIAHSAGGAGEQNEHIEVHAHGGPVQMPSAKHLGPEHLLETVPILICKGGVRQHAHAVYDSAKRRQTLVNARQHRVHRFGVRHIRDFYTHDHAALTQRLYRFFGLGVRAPASVQHDCARSPVGKLYGQGASDAAKTACYEVASVFSKPTCFQRRVSENYLPDVPRVTHELHRGDGFGH